MSGRPPPLTPTRSVADAATLQRRELRSILTSFLKDITDIEHSTSCRPSVSGYSTVLPKLEWTRSAGLYLSAINIWTL